MPYKSPLRGQRGIGSKKAQRPKRFRKDKSAESSKEKKARKPRSPWGLFGAVASFAAVWAIAVFRMQADSKQKRLSDNLLLKTLLSKPMIYTDHAICRMKCRCAAKQAWPCLCKHADADLCTTAGSLQIMMLMSL